MGVCQFVAGLGIAPSLRDYAPSYIAVRVGLYHHPDLSGARRVVSTGSIRQAEGLPSVLSRRFGGMSTDIAKFKFENYFSKGPFY